MTALSTAAWVAHDLGLATGIGGALFGRVGLQPAVRSIGNKSERAEVVSQAWNNFSKYQMTGLGIMGLTWLVGRTFLSGNEIGRYPRGMVIAKDVLVLGTLGTAIGSAVVGRKLAAREKQMGYLCEGVTRREGLRTKEQLRKTSSTLGIANLILGAGVLAVTTILAQQAAKSTRWNLLSRTLLP